jgi:fucose permease
MYGALLLPVTYAGIVSIIIKSGTIISGFCVGNILRRFGSGKVVLSGFLCIAASLYGFSFSGSMVALCLSAVPLGIGVGLLQVALNDFVAVHFKARHMYWLHSCWGIGATVGPVIISLSLASTGIWRTGYFTISTAILCMAGVVLLTLPMWKKATSYETQNRDIAGNHPGVIQLLKIKGVKSAALSFFFYSSTEASFALWGSSFLVITKQISTEMAANWFSIYFIGITLGRLTSGFLAARLSNKQQLRLGQLLVAIGILFLFMPFSGIFTQAGFFFMGLGCAPIFPGLSHDTPKNFGKEHSQAILGLQVAFAYMGATVIPPLFGFIASAHGYGLFPIFLILNLVAMFLSVESLNRKEH